jgi:hypothetical protein
MYTCLCVFKKRLRRLHANAIDLHYNILFVIEIDDRFPDESECSNCTYSTYRRRQNPAREHWCARRNLKSKYKARRRCFYSSFLHLVDIVLALKSPSDIYMSSTCLSFTLNLNWEWARLVFFSLVIKSLRRRRMHASAVVIVLNYTWDWTSSYHMLQ